MRWDLIWVKNYIIELPSSDANVLLGGTEAKDD